MDHCWGIIRALVDMLLKLDDGKYLCVKDPMKELMRVYAIPGDAFDTEANYEDEQAPTDEQAPSEPAKQGKEGEE
ncbi:hypothetical protein DUNSADRAFT_4094 [Dunaliella salina]|uniref:Uncharacterized protein n=1 Tax=Dunaliella salina TaxID=3046 RepID=A0ABQ7GST6_DUNSA|nr:hypothetical protein DUNSADRAFT_4094 [Dunaliella salina]|eukprot:KAF5837661.1 hypothetical protein DUNSADRAFT_4094 [Dunaliella salina]